MSGWAVYAAAWVLFLVSHSVPVQPGLKARLVARLGARGFAIAYSAVSVAVLAALIVAAGRAPVVQLWDWAPWQRTFAQAAMLAACVLVALAAFAPNPLSFGGWRNERFDPARPGVAGLIRHPFLAALVVWSAGHLPANGDLAHVLLFAGFAGFAALGMVMIDRRRRRDPNLAALRPMAVGRASSPSAWPLRIPLATAVWAALAALHPMVIGPSVWP